MKTLLLISACLLLFASCEEKNTHKELDIQLVEKGTLEIPIDTRTSYRTNSLTYWVDATDGQKTEYLVQLERNIPAIHFYDLNKHQLSFSIKLNIDGPEGVGRPNGLRILSIDSIFVVSGYDRKISLINGTGKTIRSCNLFKSGQIAGSNSGQPLSYTTNPLTIYGDIILLNVAPDRNTWKPEYYDAPTMMEFNFSDCTYSYFNNYPDAMRGAVWGSRGMTYSTTRNQGDQLVSSFSSAHAIQVLDLSDRAKSEFIAKSKFIEELEPLENPGMDTNRAYVFTTPSYGAIVYDPYRNIYYRTARHGIKELKEDSEFYDQPFSILILDEDFKIRGETFFPGERYNPNQFFITEDGLYLSTNNDKNPDLREDVLSFKRLEVEGIN